MPSSEEMLRSTYPDLYAPSRWGNVTLTGFHTIEGWPPADLVQSVNVVPFIGDLCMLISVADGGFLLPGGTRELGESLEETGRRELLEETGTTFENCTPFAYWDCHSADARAWRPFLAHPVFTRVVAWAEVRVVGPPTNPEDGEQIADVNILPIEEAAFRLRQANRPEVAAIYELASALR